MTKTALITGANGYIGQAAAEAFARNDYRVLGLLRSGSATASTLKILERSGITPVVVPSYDDTSGIMAAIRSHTDVIDVFVSTTESWKDWNAHADSIVGLVEGCASQSRVSWSSTGKDAKMLLIFTSGCKDYGMTGLDGSAHLAPHTEASPLNALSRVQVRAEGAARILREGTASGLYDVCVTRPTNVYGGTSSHFALWFQTAEEAKAEAKPLVFPSPAATILHSLHVDDCGDAYVALAEHQPRSDVAGQAFNISGKAYETLAKVAEALKREYGIPGETSYQPNGEEGVHMVFGYSQWVASNKIRQVTGWDDRRALFADDIGQYRREFEASRDSDQAAKSTAKVHDVVIERRRK